MIIRSHKDKNFTAFSNSVLQNENLSWEARGMLCYLISLPENWETHVTELSNRSPAGYAKNKRVLAELEASGHILRSQKRGENGRFLDWIFDIYDEPQAVTDDAVLPHSVNPNPGHPDPADQHLQITHHKKEPLKKEPVAAGDGKDPVAQPSVEALRFDLEYGFAWSAAHERLLPESRALAILRSEGIEDAGEARRIVAEWAAMAARSLGSDPAYSLVWACRNRLAATAEGDKRLPVWS